MKFYTLPVPLSLANDVRSFWVLEGEVSGQQPYIHRTMADGCAELVFHYRGIFDELLDFGKTDRSFTSGLSGPSKKFHRYKIAESFGIFGAYLYPFAISRLFQLPASELCNQSPDLHTLLGQEGSELEEKMMLASDNPQRLRILSQFLEKCLNRDKIRPSNALSVISHIIETKGTARVEQLAKDYFLSKRQFERTFKQLAGFSPKLFSRIIRFQAALSEYGHKTKSLTEIAYHCGYYDQSHFIHDFREFSGYHPSQYFKEKTEGNEWKGV